MSNAGMPPQGQTMGQNMDGQQGFMQWQRRSITDLISNFTVVLATIIFGLLIGWIGNILRIIGSNSATGTGILEAGAIIFSLGMVFVSIGLLMLTIGKLFSWVFSQDKDDRWVRVFLIIFGTIILLFAIDLVALSAGMPALAPLP